MCSAKVFFSIALIYAGENESYLKLSYKEGRERALHALSTVVFRLLCSFYSYLVVS